MKAPKFLIAALVGLMALPLASGASPAPSAVNPSSDSSAARSANVDSNSALVQLTGAPLSTFEKTKPAHGQKIDFNSNQVRNYRAQLNQLRNQFKSWLRTNAPAARDELADHASQHIGVADLQGPAASVVVVLPGSGVVGEQDPAFVGVRHRCVASSGCHEGAGSAMRVKVGWSCGSVGWRHRGPLANLWAGRQYDLGYRRHAISVGRLNARAC